MAATRFLETGDPTPKVSLRPRVSSFLIVIFVTVVNVVVVAAIVLRVRARYSTHTLSKGLMVPTPGLVPYACEFVELLSLVLPIGMCNAGCNRVIKPHLLLECFTELDSASGQL